MATVAAILYFQSERFKLFFDLQVTLMLSTKFGVGLPFGSGEEAKIDFQDSGHGGHIVFQIGMILVIFLSTSRPDVS